MKVALITSRTAAPLIEEIIASRVKGDPNVSAQIIVLPIPAIGMLDADKLKRLIDRHRKAVKDADIILVPGTIEGDVSPIADELGKPVYKASRDPGLLPLVISHIAAGSRLDTLKPAEEVLDVKPPEIEPDRTAFDVGGVRVPSRGPPLVLAAEIPPDTENYVEVAERYVEEGASLLILGASSKTNDLAVRIRRVSNRVNVPVLSEAPTPRMAREAIRAGALGISISAAKGRSFLDSVERDSVVILGEREVRLLAKAVELYRRRGFEKLIVDPVVGLPLIDYSSTSNRYNAAYRLDAPMLFSAANVATVLDADTHGVYALLAAMAVELRASVFLVVEDSYKTIHSVAEAREALKLSYAAWSRRSQPHMLGSRLLVVKQLEPPPKPTIPVEGARLVDKWIAPAMDKGYFRIEVDHERGMILVEYRQGRRIARFASRKARILARAITREIDLTPEHAAYLGEELAKAELALRTGRTYIQDSEIMRMVWED